MMLGLAWPYRKVYTLDEVVRMRCRFSTFIDRSVCEDYYRRQLVRHGERDGVAVDEWTRKRIPVGGLQTCHRVPCEHPAIRPYVERRLAGGRFPPIILLAACPMPEDGNHRVRAAQCVGDKYIDAFIPVKRPPRKR